MKRVVLSIVLAGLPFASFAQGPAPAPVPPPVPQGPTLRASVDQVVVDVVVTDADGKLVSGLTAADFELRDRGTPQAVATFSEVSLPLTIRGAGASLAAPATSAPTPRTRAGCTSSSSTTGTSASTSRRWCARRDASSCAGTSSPVTSWRSSGPPASAGPDASSPPISSAPTPRSRRSSGAAPTAGLPRR